jgi:hypothetical protein
MKRSVIASSLRIAIGTLPRPRPCLSTFRLAVPGSQLLRAATFSNESTATTSPYCGLTNPLLQKRHSSTNIFSSRRRAERCSTAFSLPKPRHIMNGTAAAASWKRKEAPELLDGRHKKHPRGISGKESAGDNTPDINDDLENGDDYGLDEARIPAILPVGADTAEWQATIENVVRNVVSIRFCQTASFDTDPALTSEATGFVVDAERG